MHWKLLYLYIATIVILSPTEKKILEDILTPKLFVVGNTTGSSKLTIDYLMAPTRWWASWKIRYVQSCLNRTSGITLTSWDHFFGKKYHHSWLILAQIFPIASSSYPTLQRGATNQPASSKIHDAPKSDSNDLKALTLGRWTNKRLERDVQLWMFRSINDINKVYRQVILWIR